jgi:zinc transporter ZupT
MTAALPDPASPSFVPFFAALGAFVGAAIVRARGLPPQRSRAVVENWAFAVTAAAMVVYVIAAIADLY